MKQANVRHLSLPCVISLSRGFDLPELLRKEGAVPVVASTGVVGFHTEKRVQGPGVVIGRSGSIGGGQFINEDFWPLNTTLWVKDFKGHIPRFVYYMLRNIDFTQFNAGSGVPTLNRNHLASLQVPFFEKNKETRISDILSAYDDLIENNRRRIRLLEESARLLYQEWFVRLRFPGHENTKIVGGVPVGWARKTAADVMDVLSGGTPKTTNPAFWDGEIPFYTPKDAVASPYVGATEKTLTEEGLRNCHSKMYPQNTVFITARGTVGKINLAQVPMAMNQSCYALVARPPINQYFMYFSLLSSVEQFRSRASGSVFDAIICDTFKLIPFVVPEIKQIELFTGYVTPMLRQIDILSRETRKLQEARDILLPRLMSGEVAV